MNESPKQPKAENPTSPAPTPAAQTPEVGCDSAVPASGAETKPRASSQRVPATRTQLPPFRVVLHNDERVDMTHVVRSIVELTPLSAPMAREIMLSAHEHGFASVLVTHLERAELYQEQFMGKGLTITVEPAG